MFLNRNLKKLLLNGFGRKPNTMYFYGDIERIRSYFDYRKEKQMDNFLIDDVTWNDLDMDEVFYRINPRLSTSGEQYLYYQLRSPATEKDSYLERKELIDLMDENDSLRTSLQIILSKLGRTRNADLTKAFAPEIHGTLWLIIYIILALLVPAAICFAFCNQVVGLWAVIGIITINGILHEKRLRSCQRDFDTVNYSVSMIFALQKIRKKHFDELNPYMDKAYQSLDRLQAIIRTGGVSNAKDGGIGDLLSMVFLLDLIAYEFIKNKLSSCHDEVFVIHETLGKLDAAIAIASFRRSIDSYCIPEIDFSAQKAYLQATDMIHPLLSNPVPNDIATDHPMLITGSNASGKSTYLKMTALCGLLAQTICTVTASSYRASSFRIYSSMALKDNLLAGESYYIVETKSLKRILDATLGQTPVLCTIDEVLRGTNTVERIAASSKILEEIARRGALCIAASHDIELCDLLSEHYDLYHFEEQLGESEMLFDYKIRHGRATSRNAINLLKFIGFDEKIVVEAHERADHYLHDRIWK